MKRLFTDDRVQEEMEGMWMEENKTKDSLLRK